MLGGVCGGWATQGGAYKKNKKMPGGVCGGWEEQGGAQG
jgi:hypothetical protein